MSDHVSLLACFIIISAAGVITFKVKQRQKVKSKIYKKTEKPKKKEPTYQDLYEDRDPPERGSIKFYLFKSLFLFMRIMICIVGPTMLFFAINNPWFIILPVAGVCYTVYKTRTLHRKIMSLSEEDYKKSCRSYPLISRSTLLSATTDPGDPLYDEMGPWSTRH